MADRRVDLELGAQKFRRHVADIRRNPALALIQQTGWRLGHEVAAYRIDDQVFLFDSDGEILLPRHRRAYIQVGSFRYKEFCARIGASARCNRTAQRATPASSASRVLPHLDHDAGQAALHRMIFHRIPGEMQAGIGLIIADHERRVGGQRRDHRIGDAPVAARQDTDMPGPLDAAKARREAVDRDQGRHGATRLGRGDPRRDRGVIGTKYRVDPRVALSGSEAAVTGYDDAFADLANCRVVRRLAVTVDDEPGIARQQGRRVEQLGQAARQRGRADVDRDMPRQLAFVEAERAERIRQAGAGVVANQQDRRRPGRVDRLDGRRLVRA